MIPLVKRTRRAKLPARAVYVGRPTRWDNPFRVSPADVATLGAEAAHRRAVERYRGHLAAHPELVAALAARHPAALACWCPPLPCHAQLLAGALAALERQRG